MHVADPSRPECRDAMAPLSNLQPNQLFPCVTLCTPQSTIFSEREMTLQLLGSNSSPLPE